MSSLERVVNFVLPDNPGAELEFVPIDSILINASGEILPKTPHTATTDGVTGAGSVTLPVPDDTGRRVFRYLVMLPDEEQGVFDLGYGAGPAELATLLAASMTPPSPPSILAALIARYALPEEDVAWLDALPVATGFFMQRTTIDADETVTIPADHQMIVAGDFTVDGDLVAVGDLVNI